MAKRKICVVTGTRAEYFLLSRLMREIRDDADLTLQIAATGTHLSPEFGLTYQDIEKDGFVIDEKIEILLSGDSPVAVAKSMALAVMGFAEAFARLKPDLAVVLGDRYEILAAAQAAALARVPLAHLHGGESTEGAVDEAFRHAITKMSHLHFTAAETYRDRVIQLGEAPARVFNVGAMGLDGIRHLKALSAGELSRDLKFPCDDTVLLVTYHPVTLANEDPAKPMGELLTALDAFPDMKTVFTLPNADTGGRVLIKMIRDYVDRHPERAAAFVSLGQTRYLSLAKIAAAVVGNSSSGVFEAPPLGTPTVNIGNRQRGRLMAPSVICCAERKADIAGAIAKAVDPDFRAEIANQKIPYGTGGAAERVKAVLKTANLDGILFKSFHDIGRIG